MGLSRRSLLHLAALSAIAAGIVPSSPGGAQTKPEKTARTIPWRNWSGAQSCTPAARIAPATEAELAGLLRTTSAPIRPVGAGHSFSALVPTDGTILSLDRLSGLTDAQPGTSGQTSLWAGTRLSDVSTILADRNRALPNMPDIDKQTLAGALSTSTHGTGQDFGSLSTFTTGLTLATATGDLIDCNATDNADLYQAARVAMGSLGVLTRATLATEPAFKLKRRTWVMPFEDMLDGLEEFGRTNRHFEFYYIPFSGMALAITHNETDEAATPAPPSEEDDSVEQLRMLQDWLGWAPPIRKWVTQKIMSTIEPEERIDTSHALLSTERNIRFNEMEYHLPREAARDALRQVRDTIEDNNIEVFFPIEFRFVKGDDIWLSPFYGRESCSIAVHRFHSEDYQPYFSQIEPVFRNHQGRPHWGKLHTLTGTDFKSLYPRWQDFQEIRKTLDPGGRFLNSHLKDIFNGVG